MVLNPGSQLYLLCDVRQPYPCIHKLSVPFGARASARLDVRKAGVSELPDAPRHSRVEAA